VQLAPDLTATSLPSLCDTMNARICVNVRNMGSANASTVVVSAYDRMGGMRLGTASTTGPVGAGRSEQVCITVPSPGVTRDYYIRVDDDNGNAECNEANNGITVTVMCGPG
jgi:subtilase family serine protease